MVRKIEMPPAPMPAPVAGETPPGDGAGAGRGGTGDGRPPFAPVAEEAIPPPAVDASRRSGGSRFSWSNLDSSRLVLEAPGSAPQADPAAAQARIPEQRRRFAAKHATGDATVPLSARAEPVDAACVEALDVGEPWAANAGADDAAAPREPLPAGGTPPLGPRR